MSKMKQQFTLACRVSGLLIFSYGFLTALSMVPMFFMKPDMARMIPQFGNLIQEMNTGADYYWVHMCLTIALVSVVPMLFGIYLMVSGRIFIDLCYPGNRSAPSASSDELPPENPAPAPTAKREDESKYMPPGGR